MNGIFINGAGVISPQKTFDTDAFLDEIVSGEGSKFTCLEPEYGPWIDAKAIRRMSRVIRMGVAAAGLSLRESGTPKPDGIITGTGLGCLDDTGSFLSKMIVNQEQSLNPTPFIQSTHNSIGSQIGLLIQCLGYNQTYVQDSFSFENTLVDAMMMLKENRALNLLVGGVDEITEISHTILSRFGLYRHGARNGEGAAFFTVSGIQGAKAYARIRGVRTFTGDQASTVLAEIKAFLLEQAANPSDIDLALAGTTGDSRMDDLATIVSEDMFQGRVAGFKHLCGEYPTASAFATWIAAQILKSQSIPATVGSVSFHSIRKVLIYNFSMRQHHSLILLEAL